MPTTFHPGRSTPLFINWLLDDDSVGSTCGARPSDSHNVDLIFAVDHIHPQPPLRKARRKAKPSIVVVKTGLVHGKTVLLTERLNRCKVLQG